MTESEYTNEQLIDFMYDVMDWRDVVDHPMIYAVIEALKERHAYRAIGTVEEIKSFKDDFWKLNEMCREYSAIGTIERFRELTEKAEPKKVDDDYCCPVCHTYAKDDEGVAGEYCPNCGQHLEGEGMEQRWQS